MRTYRFANSIRLKDVDGGDVYATLDCELRERVERFSRQVCTITLHCNRCNVAVAGPDFFEAFCRVREALETHGLIPLCYGASRNVFPSGMGRDMGDGLRAHRLQLGRVAQLTDLVDIFAEGADVDPVSVQAQREFYESWLRSL